MPRRIIRFSVQDGFTTVLCDDGSLWGIGNGKEWIAYPPIPQPTPAPAFVDKDAEDIARRRDATAGRVRDV